MLLKYDYTRLLVSNFKACFHFYRDVLGFEATFGSDDDVYADFNTGTLTLALFARNNMSHAIGTSHLPDHADAQDSVCLVFSVDDVDAASQRLVEQGVQLITTPLDRPDWGIRTVHFRDPDGNLLEIYQPLKRS